MGVGKFDFACRLFDEPFAVDQAKHTLVKSLGPRDAGIVRLAHEQTSCQPLAEVFSTGQLLTKPCPLCDRNRTLRRFGPPSSGYLIGRHLKPTGRNVFFAR